MRTGDGVASAGSAARARVLTANPAAVHVPERGADWTIRGTRPERAGDVVADAPSFGAAVAGLRSLPGAYTAVCVDTQHDTTVRAVRTVTSPHDLFYCRRPEDGVRLVTDHVRAALAGIPQSERSVPESVGPTHLLLGTRPTDTYVAEVGRLGHGEVLEWPAGGEPSTRLVDTLSVDGPMSVGRARRRLDRYLETVLDAERFDGPVATMLSGGVDSSLLQTYLDSDRTVSAAFDAPEFAFEVDYAREAADLLGVEHDLRTYDEDAYLAHLEATVDATGHPLLLPQATLIHRAVADTPQRHYVNGGLADGVFGTGTAAVAHLARYLGPVARLLPEVHWQVSAVRETAAALRRPVDDPGGCAMQFRVHADPERVADLVGREAVDRTLRRRVRYTRRRAPVVPGRGYEAHVHLGHLVECFHDNIASIWQHAATDAGAAMHLPFAGREVWETALAIPAARRYATFALPTPQRPTECVQYKHVLKGLLAERLPGYDVKKPKGHGQLPTDRFLTEGPLADVFDRYPVPEFVPEDEREAVRTGTGEVTWYAANYAVWRDRVLERDDLAPPSSTTVLEQ